MKQGIIAIIGAGSWGTAVAHAIATYRKDITIQIWSYEKDVARDITEFHENRKYLAGTILPDHIKAFTSLEKTVRNASLWILAVPSKVMQHTATELQKQYQSGIPVGILTKGFVMEGHRLRTMSQVVEQAIPAARGAVLAIYGPSHAEEVANGYHTCLTVAGVNREARQLMARILTTPYLSCHESEDIVGIELGGTLKNPAAIAAGLIAELPQSGDNLSGALLTQALREMRNIAAAFDVSEESILGISGLGDLVATSLSEHSRNRAFGREIGRRISREEYRLSLTDRLMIRLKPSTVLSRLTESVSYLAEGAYAIEPLILFARDKGIDIPVYSALYEVLVNRKDPRLLIETIKTPYRYRELHFTLGLHTRNKYQGIERISGKAFKRRITDTILASYKTTEEDSNLLREILPQGLRRRKTSLLLKKGVPVIIQNLVDRYSPFFSFLFRFFPSLPVRTSIEGLPPATPHQKNRFIQSTKVYIIRTDSRCAVSFSRALRRKEKAPRFPISPTITSNDIHRFIMKKAGGYCLNYEYIGFPLYREILFQYFDNIIAHGIPLILNSKDSDDIALITSLLHSSLMKHGIEIVVLPVSVQRIEENRSKAQLKSVLFLSDYPDSHHAAETITDLLGTGN